MARYSSVFTPADGFVFEVKKASESDWTPILGVVDWNVSGGTPTISDIPDLHVTWRARGRSVPEDVSFTFSHSQIDHYSYTLMRDAFEGGTELQWRWGRSEEKVLWPTTGAGITVAIATDGAVTTAGATGHPTDLHKASSEIGPGKSLKVGTAYYSIVTIPSGGTLNGAKVRPAPASAVTASVYSIVQRPVYQPQFNAGVGSFPQSGAQGGALSGSISLVPNAVLPAMKPGTP